MRGLSPKIILEDSQRSKNAPCIRVYNRQRPKGASKDNQSFCGSVRLSWQAHALRPRREWASSDDLHLRVPVGNPALIVLDLPLTALVGVAGRRSKIVTCTQINKNNKSKSLSDYAQQDLFVTTRRPRILDMQGFKWNSGLQLTSPYY
jgi:hypothetical protein